MTTPIRTAAYAAQLKFVLALLDDDDLTNSELCELMNLQTRSINNYIHTLTGRDEGCPRLVRIVGYDGRAPLYGLGSGPDEGAPSMRRDPSLRPPKPVGPDVCDLRDAKVRAKLAHEYIAVATSRKQEWYSSLGL